MLESLKYNLHTKFTKGSGCTRCFLNARIGTFLLERRRCCSKTELLGFKSEALRLRPTSRADYQIEQDNTVFLTDHTVRFVSENLVAVFTASFDHGELTAAAHAMPLGCSGKISSYYATKAAIA